MTFINFLILARLLPYGIINAVRVEEAVLLNACSSALAQVVARHAVTERVPETCAAESVKAELKVHICGLADQVSDASFQCKAQVSSWCASGHFGAQALTEQNVCAAVSPLTCFFCTDPMSM